MSSQDSAGISQLAELMRGKRGVVLSGAGISTESGIPDYRGASSKERSRRPILYREFMGTPEARVRYWARSMVGWPRMSAVQPNDGHRALAALEEAGAIQGIITQNVDGLHQAAGSIKVLELHGALAEVRCTDCGSFESRYAFQSRLSQLNPGFEVLSAAMAPDGDAELDPKLTRSFVVPTCAQCTGIVRPDIVFFGENVPIQRVEQAFALLNFGEYLLVTGSSLTVYSGFRFVRRAAQSGKPVAIINIGPTRGDDLAAIRIEAATGETLSRLCAVLMSR